MPEETEDRYAEARAYFAQDPARERREEVRARREEVDGLYHRHLLRAPDAEDAVMRDGLYRAQMETLRRLLHHTDQAMEFERIPVEVRDRVIRTLLYGCPDPVEARRRERDREAVLAKVRSTPSEELRRLIAETNAVGPAQ